MQEVVQDLSYMQRDETVYRFIGLSRSDLDLLKQDQ